MCALIHIPLDRWRQLWQLISHMTDGDQTEALTMFVSQMCFVVQL